jgi:hypothetical protein
MFNSFDRLFRLSNSRNECKTQQILCFAKHHNLCLYVYDAMCSTDHFHAIDRFFIIKVQMIDPTIQNNFHMNIFDVDQILYFLNFLYYF